MLPEKLISHITNHKYVRLTNRGNSAIRHAIKIIKALTDKPYILIPDQGGWLTYKQYSVKEGFKVKEIKTDNGLISPKALDLTNAAAVIVTQPAGYFADQDLKSIYEVCKNKCIVITDITGSIGDKTIAQGEHADILLGSFGEWKPVNLEYGGFISFKDKKLHNISQKITLNEFDSKYNNQLIKKLKELPQRYQLFHKKVKQIKQDLKSFKIIHKDNKGLNVIIAFKDDTEKQKIIKYCSLHKLPYTLCPRYIRVNQRAISIEVKRL